MIEIIPNLFVGAEQDYEFGVKGKPDWIVVHACKEPYHRRALGYTSHGAPKNHPEYLIAERTNRLILNLVDSPDPNYIPKEIIDVAIDFIHEALGKSRQVLVHCNMGESRSPSIGLLYLARYTDKLPKDFRMAEEAFRGIYPFYRPSTGMRGFLSQNWESYLTK
jgi:predicted protein tyrosine phosphatase